MLWTSGLLSCQAPLPGTAWSAKVGIAKNTNLPHERLGKGNWPVCNKRHWAKSHLELHRSCVVFLANHFLQLLLQVLLSRVLDINVVTLWAGKVAADALCEESGHHSLSHWLQTTAGNKPCAFQTVDTSLLPYRSQQQIPSSFPSALESVPLEKYSCCWHALLPSLLPLPHSLSMSCTIWSQNINTWSGNRQSQGWGRPVRSVRALSSCTQRVTTHLFWIHQ